MPPPLLRLPGRSPRRPGLIVLSLLLPALGWLSVNWWDQSLSDAARARMEALPPAAADADNLFLALLAFPIQGDEPAHVRGRAALDAYARAAAAGAPPESYAQALDRHTAVFDEGGAKLCGVGNQPGAYACLRQSLEDRAALQALVQHVAPLLARYPELERYSVYVDPRPPSVDIPPPDLTVLRIAQLQLSVFAWAVEAGEVDRVAEALTRSADVWRRMLAARDIGPIPKVMAQRLLAAHLLFASEWIARQPSGADLPLDALLAPLTEVERSLEGPLVQEFRLQAALWQRLGNPRDPVVLSDFPQASSWWYPLLMKPNETIHRSHRELESLLALERQGCVAVAGAFEAAQEEGGPSAPAWYEYGYNPIGRVLQSMSDSRGLLLGHLARSCNLVALQRMVGLQRELHRRGISRDATAAQVEQLAAVYVDPNTGKAFRYDPITDRLSFAFIGAALEPMAELPLDGAAAAP